MTDRWSLRGKTALVTGCTSGIGLGIADELLRFGASADTSSGCPSCGRSLTEELKARGYDLTTLKFSIQHKGQ